MGPFRLIFAWNVSISCAAQSENGLQEKCFSVWRELAVMTVINGDMLEYYEDMSSEMDSDLQKMYL